MKIYKKLVARIALIITLIVAVSIYSYNKTENEKLIVEKEKILSDLIVQCCERYDIDTANLYIKVFYDKTFPSDIYYIYKIEVHNDTITSYYSDYSKQYSKESTLNHDEYLKLITLTSKIKGYIIDLDFEATDLESVFMTISNNIVLCTNYGLCDYMKNKDEEIYKLLDYLEKLSPITIDYSRFF